MAWTFTDRGSSEGYGGGTGVDIGDTFTPTEGNYIVVALMVWTSNTIDSITAASWNITFSQIGSNQTNGSDTFRIYAGRVGSSPSSDAVNLDINGDANYNACIIEVAESVNGIKSAVADAFERQTPLQETSYNGGSGNAIGAGFSSFEDSGNACLVCLCSGSQTQTFTPQSGFTALMEQSTSYGATAIHYKTTEETGPTYSVNEGFQDNAAFAFEVAQVASSANALSLNNASNNGGF